MKLKNNSQLSQNHSTTSDKTKKTDSVGGIVLWLAVLVLSLLHLIYFPHIAGAGDYIGREGLKRVIINSIATLPMAYWMAGGILVEGIALFKNREQFQRDIRILKQSGLLKGLIVIWISIFCIAGWLCYTESKKLICAALDWKATEGAPEGTSPWEREGIDSIVLEQPSIGKRTYRGNVLNTYYLESSNTPYRFSFGRSIDRELWLEMYIGQDRELTVYYYHYSHVLECVCSDRNILLGE